MRLQFLGVTAADQLPRLRHQLVGVFTQCIINIRVGINIGACVQENGGKT